MTSPVRAALRADGVKLGDVKAAIQAAGLAGDFALAAEIAQRYELHEICLYCAERRPRDSRAFYSAQGKWWPVCDTCEDKLDRKINFSDVKLFTQGLVKRNVI